ncbi:MAG: ATP-binding protein [Pyrinomonadaceae bacterium]
MSVRHKAFAVFFVCCAAPLLLLCALFYLIGTRAVETQMRAETKRAANAIAQRLSGALDERERNLSALAQTRSVRSYVLRNQSPTNGNVNTNRATQSGASAASDGAVNRSASESASTANNSAVPENVRRDVGMFLLFNENYFADIACVGSNNQPLFRVEPTIKDAVSDAFDDAALRFQTTDFSSDSARPDERVWTAADGTPVRSPVAHDASGAIMRYSIPIRDQAQGHEASRGALIADLKLDALLRRVLEASAIDNAPASASDHRTSLEPDAPPRLLLLIDRAGQILYHTNDALRHQSVARAMPSFSRVAAAMQSGASVGSGFFDNTEGARWLAAFQAVPALDSSLAVAEDYSAATMSLRRAFWLGSAFSLLASLVAAALLLRFVRRTKGSIERVTENAVAIAGGNLSGRIEVRSSDDMCLLADTFNQMTERLREQMAREAETRQFESFMRLSAMLTHDLKNAIASLSLIVRNMERQFHHAEFRQDAMQSLTEATDKLRALVAKLSEPVRSLSGEFPAPRPTDLIPILRRVLAANVESASELYEIETRLPATLVAVVDAERIEKVVENLVLNAVEAMGAAGGKFIVEGGTDSEREIFFSVADTGPGMSEEFQRTKLFHAFATTKKAGVGLGLYTCREIVKAHGGRLEVQSEKGAGTCFRVVLPSPRTAAKEAIATQA